MKAHQKHVFVFDIDGTLLGPIGNKLGRDAIKALKIAGSYGDIVLASARPLKGIKSLYDGEELKINHIVALNGALTMRGSDFFDCYCIDAATLEYFLIHENSFENLWFFTKDEWYSNNLHSKAYLNERKSVSFDALPLAGYKGEVVLKITIVINKDIAAKIEELNGVSSKLKISKSCGSYIEVHSKETDKYLASKKLYSATSIKLFSFGDSDNDLTLLKNSYFSCTVANGTFQVKSCSNYVSKLKYGSGVLDCVNYIVFQFSAFQ